MARRARKPKGLKTVEKNLGNALKDVVKGAHAGLVKGGLLVEKRSKMNVPVRTGNLRSSGFSMSGAGVEGPGASFTGPDAQAVAKSDTIVKSEAAAVIAGKKARKVESVAVGHTAPYATSVHENPSSGARGYDARADRPGLRAERVHSKVGGWKFLENALKESHAAIMKFIADGARTR